MTNNLRNLLLGAFACVPLLLTGCTPECVDKFDCDAKAKKDSREYTCVSGACVQGSAFPDAGSAGGGGGTTGGNNNTTGGGGGTTGGGGGTTGGGGGDMDAGLDDAGIVDAGIVDAGMDDAGIVDAGMDDAGIVDAGMDDAGIVDAGVDAGMTDSGVPELELAQIRGTAQDGGTTAVDVSAATVTYLKPLVGTEAAGFFVQAAAMGPAIYVAVDPATLTPAPQVGDRVAFKATTYALVTGFSEITTISNWQRLSSGGSISSFTQDLTASTTVAASIDSLESELISIRGVLDAGFSSAGSPYVGASIGTTASPADNVRFRAPQTLVDSLELERGCDITVGPTPMWRFNTQAQPNAWVAGDVVINACPAPTVVSAVAPTTTSVVVTFSRSILGSSVQTSGSQFTFNNGLTASAAVVAGKTVTITTTAQTGGTSYLLTVASSVTDSRAAAVGTPNTATFVGFETRAQVRINEINANIAGGCDLIELRVVSGGSMNGFRLQERDTATLVTFTSFTVATNDLIVVHMNSPAVACNANAATQETTSINQQPSATFAGNYNTAWDWWSTDTGLTNTDNTITLYDPSSNIVDAVLVANLATGLAAAGSETQAAAAAAVNQWQMVGGGIPTGGFVDDNFRAHAALDLDATGTTATTGDSIGRVDNTDDNDKADWSQAPQTFGATNVGQTPFP